MLSPAILIAENNQYIHQYLSGPLFEYGYRVIEASEHSDILHILKNRKPNLILIEPSNNGNWDGLQVAHQVRNKDSKIPIILVTKPDKKNSVVQKLGTKAKNYVIASSLDQQLMDIIKFSLNESKKPINNQLDSKFIGHSMAMNEVKSYLTNVAPTDCTVLITGETGTGKELTAQMIHNKSKRTKEPFICINCAAIPENLLESELFGYEKGAFTGASSSYPGKLILAGKGTVFLDEIGDMTLKAQTKILRVLETKEIYPLGAQKSISLDARIVAATNQDLEKLMKEGLFREDLYFRLNVASVELPPLRNRKEDIVPLLEHFIKNFNLQYTLNVEGVSNETLDILLQYNWQGNIRELKNLLEACYINFPSKNIEFSDLPKNFTKKLKKMEMMQSGEREQILSALYNTKWNKSKAAELLKWSRMTLYRKMIKYNIIKNNVIRRTDAQTYMQ